MKFFIATLLIAVTVGEAYSQDRNRGRRNNNNGSRVERGNRGNNGPRGNGRVERNRTVEHRNHRGTDRGRNMDTRRPHSGDRRVDPSRRTPPPRRHVDPRVNRDPRRRGVSVPAGRVRRPHARPDRRYYGSRDYHRPSRYSYRPYRSYRHAPVTRRYSTHRRYNTRYDYYNFLRRNYRSHIYLNWVLFPSSRMNGYYFVDNYPYYIYNGYRHRYSYEDVCNYQLVDKYTHQVVRSNYPMTCARGYDACAADRDAYNSSEREYRYFCAETIREDGYDYSSPTYDYNEYDDYDNGRTTCYDYDPNTGICYDNY